jgi:hypothetical protein
MATKAKAGAKKSAKRATKSGAGAGDEKRVSHPVAKAYKAAKVISVGDLPADFSRADLEFIRVEHSDASYEGRVFLNNPKADENTPPTEENGYAGSFYIFGHGGCFGDVGHCEINRGAQDAFDPRPSHPLLPIRKVVIATEAIKRAAAQGDEINVTVVPVIVSWTEQADLSNVMKFDHINLAVYD